MFNSKGILFIIGILMLCLVLCLALSENISKDNLNSDTNSDDVRYIWMMEDNGEVKLIPTTENYAEGSASAPG